MNKRLLFLVAGAALLASACVKINLSVDIEDDGSGTVEGLVAVDFNAFAELAEGFGEDAGFSQEEICSDFETDSGIEGSEFDQVTPYNEGGFCGAQFSTRFSAGELQGALGGLDAGQARVEQVDGGWRFELDFDAGDLSTDGAGDFPGLDDIFDGAEYIVRVRLPGKQADHNGSFIDSEGFVVWEIDLLNPPDQLFLVTEPGATETGSKSAFDGGGGGGAGTVILIVVLALVALGIAAYFLTRNKNGDDGATLPAVGGIETTQPIPTAPPVTDQGAPVQDFAPPAEPTPAPTSDTSGGDDAAVIASPTPEQATGEPVWDPARRKYVQWDPNKNVWLVFNDDTQTWTPE